MKKILILSITCLFAVNIFAQEELIRCGNDLHQAALQAEYPDFMENAKTNFEEALLATAQTEYKSDGVVYTIPVVIHIVYKNQTENLSDAQIQSQLDVLNLDYRGMNSDIGQVPGIFANLATDAELEFCLASVDPNGNQTTGITRTPTNVSSFSLTQDNIKQDALGGKSPWDTNRYLNIWVGEITGGILGYATPPGTPAARDGVVIGFRYFGTSGTAQFPYNRGRTCTHEIGHYFALQHIWGGGGCASDDGIADTPLQDMQYGGCPSLGVSTTSCGSQDMFMNYMDYVDDRCMFMFTHGQRNFMRYIIDNFRPALIQSAPVACDPTGGQGCQDLTQADITMGFEDGENLNIWDVVDNNNDNHLWEFVNNDDANPSVAGSRTGSNFMVYTYNTYNAADDWLFSPCIDLKAGRDYELSFWYATAEGTNTAYPERLGIALTLSPSPDFTAYQELEELVQPYNPDLPNSNYAEYNLEFFTQTDVSIHIGFHCYSDADQFALLIDDIQIRDVTPSVSNEDVIANEAFSTYPNPASDQLTLDFNFDETIENIQVNLVDLTGKTLYTTAIDHYTVGNFNIDVSNYPSGVYFLNVQADEQMTTEKIVISK